MGKMTKRKRDLLSMALSGVVLIALYFSLFRPPERSVARSRQKANAVSNSAKEAAKKIASFPGVRRKVEEHRERLKSLKEKMRASSTENPSDVAKILVSEAKRLGLDVSISRDVDSETPGQSGRRRREVSFRAQMPINSYRSFAEYVEAIGKAGETIAVEEISLKRQDAGGKKMLRGELTVTTILMKFRQ